MIAPLIAAFLLLAQNGQTYSIKEPGVTKPHLLRKVEPKYTKDAKKARIEGMVKLKIIISAEGRAEDFSVEKSLDPGLDEQAIIAVKKWRFKPSTKDGAPVRVHATVEVTFHLL